MRGAIWTPDEEAQLLGAFGSDLTVTELAEVFDRTEAAVLSRLIRLRRITYDPHSRAYHKIDPEPWARVT